MLSLLYLINLPLSFLLLLDDPLNLLLAFLNYLTGFLLYPLSIFHYSASLSLYFLVLLNFGLLLLNPALSLCIYSHWRVLAQLGLSEANTPLILIIN